MYLKINNLIQISGEADYKGLELSRIVGGSQVYPSSSNIAILKYAGDIVENPDIEVIDEGMYLAEQKKYLDELNSSIPLDDELEALKRKQALMQSAIDDLIMGGLV